ncbi:Lrp/AsnC ligand binding domain-containing protein [Sphingobium sp. EP60837]|uniref:Lrp/AsnC ligand binding domain-containing protein n=1 Tax=Sphingobium sp. EP60837 TaxID=1855519 RepID=UPI0009EEC04A|nr:Lrp/AsnC ligand binding domain-containing protein [Sphingobium sp. EP60837]
MQITSSCKKIRPATDQTASERRIDPVHRCDGFSRGRLSQSLMMGVDAEPSCVRTLPEQLRRISEINCVVLLVGRFNLLATSLFTNIEQLDHLVKTQTRNLPGVQRVETAVSVHNPKYEEA